jgi:hypothetical protein
VASGLARPRRKPQPPTGLEHAERFLDHPALVGRKIDDAVRDDDVHCRGGQRNRFYITLQEDRVLDSCLHPIRFGEGEHVVGHVEAVRASRGPDPPRRQQDIDAAARAEVEHDLAGREIGQGRGIATAQRGQHGLFGNPADLSRLVQVTGHRIHTGAAAAAGGPLGPIDFSCDRAVLGLHRFLQ